MIGDKHPNVGGQYKDLVEVRQHIKMKRVLYWYDRNIVRKRMVKCYYENPIFFIQDTEDFSNEYKQSQYALSINKYACVAICHDNDFMALVTFIDYCFDKGIDFDNYTVEMNTLLSKGRNLILGHPGYAPYQECLAALDWSRETYRHYIRGMKENRLVKRRQREVLTPDDFDEYDAFDADNTPL